VQICVKLFDLS